MDKGIRPFAIANFQATLPARENSAKGNTAFRKGVISAIMDSFGCTLAAAATHYNHAFIATREAAKTNETLAAQLVGLGRPEDKKGGRKKKAVEATPAAEVAPQGDAAQAETAPEQTVFRVCKKSDGSVVAEGLSFEDAKALVEKAAAAKKAKLYWV